MIGYDIDGVIFADPSKRVAKMLKENNRVWPLYQLFTPLIHRPEHVDYVAITGRLDSRLSRFITKFRFFIHGVRPKAIYFRQDRGMQPSEHKANAIKSLGITHYYESCPYQTKLIRRMLDRDNYECSVYCWSEDGLV